MKLKRVLVVTFALVVWPFALLSAGAEVKTPSTSGTPTNVEADSSTANRDTPVVAGRPTPNRQGYVLRCWNFGRLVYEGPVSGPAQGSGASGITVPVSSGRPKQILDMKQGLCIID
ncbi:MAG: hypothetical protein ACKVQU_01885 [Burkholderiales bacterium]